ncbi:MAG: hypothetical protein RIT45_289 [Pseudomonadota bacterium]
MSDVQTLQRGEVLDALATVAEPDLGGDLVSLDMVRDVTIEAADGGVHVGVRIALSTYADPAQETLQSRIAAALRGLPGVVGQAVQFTVEVPGSGLPNAAKLPGVRHVIGVGAGKGGVGKSTAAVNLAVSLAAAGARVGLLDADIYGPSVPIMMGLADTRPRADENRRIQPLFNHGVKFISMGNMIGRGDAVVWRGPMVGRAVTQLFDDVHWGELDYLVVDLPPGTGDVVLSMAQTFPLSGAVVVATPQDVAFADVTRAVKMFEMLHVDVLGLVENMAYFVAPDTGNRYEIFGPSRTADHCANANLALLGSLPLNMDISPAADAGHPICVSAPRSDVAETFRAIAGRVGKALAQRALSRGKAADHSAFFASAPGA